MPSTKLNNIMNNKSGAKWKEFSVNTRIACLNQNGYFGPDNDKTEPYACSITGTNNSKTTIVPKKFTIAGMYKPFVNYQQSIGFTQERKNCISSIKAESGDDLAYPGTKDPYGGLSSSSPFTSLGNSTKDPHSFRARPMKHYRLQYGNDNNKQTYNNRYLLRNINKPGGTNMKTYSGISGAIGDTNTDGLWIETMAAYNIIKYGKDKGFHSTKKLEKGLAIEGEFTPECFGDDRNWEKLIEAGVSKEDIIEYGFDELCFSKYGPDDTLQDAMVGYPNYTLGKLNKVGKYNPIYFSTNNFLSDDVILDDDNYTPNNNWACTNCPNYQCQWKENGDGDLENKKICAQGNKKCVNICDPPTKAKKRVRTSSSFNKKSLCQRTYYPESQALLKSRCKTFKQNQFQYKQVLDSSVQMKGNVKSCDYQSGGCCGRSAACSQAYRGNCPTGNKRQDCNGNIVGCKNKVYYKPNNCQFSQQGGVSSSSRLLRLKLNTINSSANSVKNAYGQSAASALMYSGRPQAPFINKQKMNAGGYIKSNDYMWLIPILDSDNDIISYETSIDKPTSFSGYTTKQIKMSKRVMRKLPCDNNQYFLYRPGGGNPVTSVMNGPNNNKIIGRFCQTSVYPNFNADGSEPNKFTFMNRQNMKSDKIYERVKKK